MKQVSSGVQNQMNVYSNEERKQNTNLVLHILGPIAEHPSSARDNRLVLTKLNTR